MTKLAAAREWALFNVTAMLLLLPFALNGGAGYFADIAPYVKGGFVAFDRLAELFSSPDRTLGGGARGGGLAGQSVEVKGVRSVVYSVASYLAGLGGGRFWLLAVSQSVVAYVLLRLFFRTLAAPIWALPVAVLLAPALSFGVGAASPDVWAGLVILSLVLLVVEDGRLRQIERALVVLAAAFGIAAHSSHLPVGLAVLVAALPLLLLQTRHLRTSLRRASAPAVAVSLGLAITVLTGLVGFGEVSLAPKRYPLTLARTIENGPGLWHLQEHCDKHAYVVCDLYPDGVPETIGAFLWGPNGVAQRASQEELDKLREEEIVIVRRALDEYPLHSARTAVALVAKQLVSFDLNTGRYRVAVSYAGRGRVSVRDRPAGPFDSLLRPLDTLGKIGVGIGVLAPLLAFCLGWRPDRDALTVGGLIVFGCLVNAAVCALFSTPVDRYQARVVWLLPIAAAVILTPHAVRSNAFGEPPTADSRRSRPD